MAYPRLLRGRIKAYLGADLVSVVRERALWRRHAECASAHVAPDDAGAQPWIPAISALGELIAKRGWGELPIDVALSSEFVRFALVPEIKTQLSTLEMQGLAHSMFAPVLGEATADWNVRYCAVDGTTVLASAVEKALLAALEDLARTRRCVLRSVTPLWSCVANGQHARLARGSVWLVLAETRAAAFGLIEQGRWRAVRAKALDAGQGADIARLLERESRLLGSATRDVILVGEHGVEGFPAGWNIASAQLVPARYGGLPAECHSAALAGT